MNEGERLMHNPHNAHKIFENAKSCYSIKNKYLTKSPDILNLEGGEFKT
jgi:hypothetical protein